MTRDIRYLCAGMLATLALTTLTFAPVRAEPLNVNDVSNVTQTTAMQSAEPMPPPVPSEAAPGDEVVVESIVAEPIVAEPIDPCHIVKPVVHYRVRGHCPPCCESAPPIETTMLVKDPASCDCYAEIPVCLPCCCVGEASICNRDGILGRSWVDYEWDCGFKISVLFRARGDVVVHYIF